MRPSFVDLQQGRRAADRTLKVTDDVTGGKGQLFGGVLVGAAIDLLEAEHPGRRVVWISCQFAAPANAGDSIDLEASVAAKGRSIVQATVAGSIDGKSHSSILAALGGKPFPDTSPSRAIPDVPSPDECEPLDFDPGRGGLNRLLDCRAIDPPATSPRHRSRYWLRFDDCPAGSVYSLAIAADFFPPSLSSAVGRRVFGASLDNTLRLIDRSDSPWLLGEMTVDAIQNGIAHGTTHLWSIEGQLLAIGSQTCAVSEFT